jgi:hypothetical protein
MAYPPGSVRLSAPVGVGSDQDNFGTHYDILGVGGYRSVANQSGMEGIPALRRKKGMLVYRQDNNTIYKYMSDDGTKVDDIGNSSATIGWVPLSFSGGSSLPGNPGDTTKVYFLKNSNSSSTWSQTWAELTTSDISNFTSVLNTALNTKENSITTLPITKGGTNSSNALNNNRIMISSGDAIVEASSISGNEVLVSNSNGIPIASGVASSALGNIANKLNIIANTETGGSTLTTLIFSGTDTIYGTPANEKTGGIAVNMTGAKIGVTHIVIHKAASLDLSGISQLKKLSGSGNYVPNVDNVIFFTCIDSSTVIYSINQI